MKNLRMSLLSNSFFVAVLQTLQYIAMFLFQVSNPKYVLIPPAWVKRKMILKISKDSNLDSFVESGSYLGLTSSLFAKNGFLVHTIEIDPNLHRHVVTRLKRYHKATAHFGDAAEILQKLLPEISTKKALFFLDAHHSKGITSRNQDLETNLSSELLSVKKFLNENPSSVVVLDDVHEFGSKDYPSLSEVVNSFANYQIQLSWNMLIIRHQNNA